MRQNSSEIYRRMPRHLSRKHIILYFKTRKHIGSTPMCFLFSCVINRKHTYKLMFSAPCSHISCRDRRPRRSESEGYVRTHLEREKRCRSLICSNISHVHGPPRTSVPTRLVRFFIIDYRRKSRCLTEDFRSATNMFAQIIFREWRSR